MRKPLALLLLVALLGVTAACGEDEEPTPEATPTEETDTGAVTEETDPCAKEELATVKEPWTLPKSLLAIS